jgi:monofunctional biosynthetic peptidoglycan transglycosylase
MELCRHRHRMGRKAASVKPAGGGERLRPKGCNRPARLYANRHMSERWRAAGWYILAWAGRVAVALALVLAILVPVYRVVPPVSTLMAYEWVTKLGHIQRTWVPLDAIAPSLAAAVMMSEDARLCSHDGVDWLELNKAVGQQDDRPRGASTIAMQSVKNLFLWPSRSYLRKLVEIPLALYADVVWGKRREMEIYLNIVEWGPGIFGAEAASRHYFHRPASALTLAQATLLAVALPNPLERDPASPGPGLKEMAATVAARVRTSGGYIDCLYPRTRL